MPLAEASVAVEHTWWAFHWAHQTAIIVKLLRKCLGTLDPQYERPVVSKSPSSQNRAGPSPEVICYCFGGFILI